MRKENRWTHGTTHLVVPPLPEDFKGRHGCSLHRAIFDTSVGEEVYLAYLEKPDFAEQFGQVSPFILVVRFGLARTPHGVVAFIIWEIALGSPEEIIVEQYLNPQNIEALDLIESAANQTHFKLVVINNQSSEVGAFIDFENVFHFNQLASAMDTAFRHEPTGDFGAAMQYIMDTMTIPELLVLSLSQHGV